MANKILSFTKKMNLPFVKFVVTKGWYLRLVNKKNKNAKFRRLSKEEKLEIKQYWRSYGKNISTDWCAYFSYGSGIVDKKFVPESLYYGEILRGLNDYGMGALHHKNVADQIFSSKQPKTILRKDENVLMNGNYEPISLEKGLKLCEEQGSVIIKPSTGTYGGSGIDFWSKEEGERKLREVIGSLDKIIIQEVVKSHPFLESIHPESLNTLRVVTLLVDGKPVHLSTILRMGRNNKKVDNYSAGGIICPINKEGRLFETAVQSDQSVITKHPDGFVFKGKKVPFFNEIINDAYRQHYRVPYFKMISWDFSLSPEGVPILIEANIPSGQLDLHQLNIGSIFGEYTDRVLDFVYKDKKL